MNESEISALSRFILVVKNQAEEANEAEDQLIYEKYLSLSSIILTKLNQNKPIDDDVSAMEKLFGNTWLKNDKDYKKAYEAWDIFKELLVRSIYGMTVNERLFNLGLLEEFDKAVAKKDESRLRTVLFKCLLDESNIQAIIDNEF